MLKDNISLYICILYTFYSMELTNAMLEENAKRLYENLQSSLRIKIAANKTYAEETADAVVTRLVEELLLEVLGDVHRSIKLGYSDLLYSRIYDQSLDESDLPFDPEEVDSKTEDINCPKCDKLTHASRFAHHLERCMHQGRSSSRIASQRIANNSKECSYAMGSDEDEEWKAEKSRSTKKLDSKKKKDFTRKQKTSKSEVSKNQRETGNAISANIKDNFQSPTKYSRDNYSNKGSKELDSDGISPNKLIPIVNDERVNVHSPRCGVKSDHTGKYCGRSLRCPLHSDAERAVARKMLAGESMDIDVEDVDYSKNVLGNFSHLDITPNTPSKKKEKQKHGVAKY